MMKNGIAYLILLFCKNKHIPIIINILFSFLIAILGYIFLFTDGVVFSMNDDGSLNYANQRLIFPHIDNNDNIFFSFILFGISFFISFFNFIINIIFKKNYYFSTYFFILFWVIQIFFTVDAFIENSFVGTLKSGNIIFYLWMINIIVSIIIIIYMRIFFKNKV